MKIIFKFAPLLFLLLTMASCATQPAAVGNNANNNQGDPDNGIKPFKVSEELYVQTFDEIKILIEKLNKIIASKSFNEWKKYLSSAFITKYSDSQILAEYSETPILKENKIVLRKIDDYFKWVVVPSRSNVHLDEIVFLNENQIMAYMLIDNRKTILYQLEKIEGKWKISTW